MYPFYYFEEVESGKTAFIEEQEETRQYSLGKQVTKLQWALDTNTRASN